jgi:hypothetical protein
LLALVVSFGILEWRDDDGESYRSPLVLLPVALTRSLPGGRFVLAVAGQPSLNPVLEARFLGDFAFHLPTFDGCNTPLAEYLAQVQETVAGLPGWRAVNATALGILPLFDRAVWGDLTDNAERFSNHPFLQVLVGSSGAEVLGGAKTPAVPEPGAAQTSEMMPHVLDADHWQRRCLEAARRGASFVILGPPGTGKSQTIGNLVADCLAAGKTVLVVSTKAVALETVAARLRQVGLSDFCLELHGEIACSQAVLADLGRCLEQIGTAPGHETRAPDMERLRECTERLNSYVEALHRQREPFQQSAWWALGELARCHDLPAVPLQLAEATEISVGWLEEARQALLRAGQLAGVRNDPAFPWRGFKLDRYHKQLRDEVLALVEKARARLERLNGLAREYGKQVASEGPVSWLLRVADLLESNPKPPPLWLTVNNFEGLAQDLDRAAGAYGQRSQSREPLTARYGPGIWQLPEGTAAQLDATWQQVRPMLALADEKGAGFLDHQQPLRGWAADTLRRLPGWLAEARILEKWLGLDLPKGIAARPGADRHDPAVTTLRRLLRLANLCQSETPPPRSWVLDPAALEQARRLIDQARPAFQEFRQARTGLLDRYTEAFFELDMERLGAAYDGNYRSWLRILSPQFRRDRRAIRRRTVARVLPPTIADDVLLARELQRSRLRLEAEGAQRQPILGRYEKGLATDLDAAERATRVAGEAAELARQLGCASIPDRLADAVSAQGPAPDKAKVAARRLHDSLAAWLQHTHELEAVLPLKSIPGAGVALEDVAASALQHYVHELQSPLNHFAALADPVLSKAITPPPDVATLLNDLAVADGQRGGEPAGVSDVARWREQLGPGFQGATSDWSALRRCLAWAQRLRALFAERPATEGGPLAFPEIVVSIVTGQASLPSSREMRAAREQLEHSLHSLEIRFESPGPTWNGMAPRALPPEQLQQWLGALRVRVEGLAAWADLRIVERRLEHLGLTKFWAELQKIKAPVERFPDLFLKAALASWLNKAIQEEPALGSFQRAEHDQIIEEFCRLDQDTMRQAAGSILRQARTNPEAIAAQKENLLNKARDAMPYGSLQPLFAEFPDLLLRLKPCVLINPSAVAALLPADRITFDMVVFDEASQLDTAAAISAIGRARQVIVCGDDQQLLPHGLGTGVEPPGLPGSESLLGACLAAGVPAFPLSCAYRALHEGLIAFANRHSYENTLATFPGADGIAGVCINYVPDGSSEGGINRREAEVVADLVFKHLHANKGEKSLGVVTFSQVQANAITEAVEHRFRGTPEVGQLLPSERSKGFFVKNVDEAQGDERDVILLSIGVGPPAESGQPIDFGPIAQENGDRRLIVAATLAQVELVVVSSLRVAEIPSDAGQRAGVRLLRAFLDFAERGTQALDSTSIQPPPALVADVMAATRQLGFDAVPGVGSGTFKVDVGVRATDGSGRFILGILCDGPGEAEDMAPRDCHRLRPSELARRGWRLHHVWAQAWVMQRQEELDRLARQLTS